MIRRKTYGYDESKVTLKKGKQGGTVAVSTSPAPNRKPSKYLHPDDLPDLTQIEVTAEELIEHDKAMSKTPQPRFLDLMR